MPKKILLFGGYGMLGTALQQALSSHVMTAPRHNEIDITDRAQLQRYIIDQKPEIIVNAAAYTKVDDCEQNQTIAFTVNGMAPGYMAEVSEQIGAYLIQYSTDYVFSGTKADGYKETDQPDHPVNVYGASKLAGEQAIQRQTDRYTIIRTAWLYGFGGQNFVDTMLRLGQEQKEVKVVNDQHGSPTYTVDLAAATAQLIAHGSSTGIYHLTNSGSCTWYEFAQEIFAAAQMDVTVLPCTSSEFPRPAKRPRYSRLVNTKLPPLRSWQKALADYIASSSGQR